jgi:hypothetical protein
MKNSVFCVETAFNNGLLKERYKGVGIEMTGRQERRRRKLLEDTLIWKRLWTCRKTDY